MALATLQGTLVPGGIPWTLTLSHTESLDGILPERPVCAQFVKTSATKIVHDLKTASAQQLFRYFRSAGPLVFVHTDVDVGYKYRTCVLEYWNAEDAGYARMHCQWLHPAMGNMQPFMLSTFSPHSVMCTVSAPLIVLVSCSPAIQHLGKFFRKTDVQSTFGEVSNVLS